MITYVVERRLPGVAAGDLTAAATRARDAADQLSREGMPIRYLGSVPAGPAGPAPDSRRAAFH
jgi:hypothetical protein